MSLLQIIGNTIVYNTALLWPDELYIKLRFYFMCGYLPNLRTPQNYNEKLQWLKVNDYHEDYSVLVDKYEVKSHVESIIGSEHIIPTIGVWDSFQNIDFDNMPNQFVLKTTHDSGGVVIVKDKQSFDCQKAAKLLTKSLRNNFYKYNREYPYKSVKPRIIAEEYLVDESGQELKDYKFFCFNGVPKVIQVDYDRFNGHKRNMYDTEWKRLPFTLGFPTDWKRDFSKPKNLDLMLDIASRLSKNIPHVRVDLYNVDGHVYFGELTFFHGGGYEKFTPKEWDHTFGDWIVLPQ